MAEESKETLEQDLQLEVEFIFDQMIQEKS